MKICAIILNYYSWQDTAACCAALAGQDVDRIVVVENSAAFDERQAIQQICSNIPNATVLTPEKNLGFAGGVNCALRELLPRGFDAFLILNNDTVPPPDLISKLCHGMTSACLDIVSPVIYRYPEKDSLWSRGNYYNIWAGFITHTQLPLPGNFFYLPGCCLLIQSDVFTRAGLFDEDFFMYGEDVAFCHRAAHCGFRLGVVPDARLYHKTGSASANNPLFYEEHIARAHLLLSGKLFDGKSARLLSLSLKILFLLLRAGVRSLRHMNLNAFLGLWAAAGWYNARTP